MKPELTYNIDSEKIKQIIRNKIFVEKEVIARGEEAIIDEEAQIVLEVDTEVSSETVSRRRWQRRFSPDQFSENG